MANGQWLRAKKMGRKAPFFLVRKFVLLRAEAWEKCAVAVAALNGYLENLKFRCCVFHNAIHFFVLSSLRGT